MRDPAIGIKLNATLPAVTTTGKVRDGWDFVKRMRKCNRIAAVDENMAELTKNANTKLEKIKLRDVD